jgi:hypothetical protein
MNNVLRALFLLAAGLLIIAPSAGSSAPLTPEPALGQRETVTLIAGKASVRSKGTAAFVALSGTISLPDESEVDASHGRVEVTVATPQPGQTATAVVYQGQFLVHQETGVKAETHLTLSQSLSTCGVTSRHHRARGRKAKAVGASHHPSRSRHIWVSDHGGSWGTNGHYVSTTVEGTRWLTLDTCNRSEVKVAEGTVLVHDLILDKSVKVSAGHEYVAAQEGKALMPPLGQVFSGQTGGSSSAFQSQVGKHPAIYGYFGSWGGKIQPPLSFARGSGARLLLHVSTDYGYGEGSLQTISPAAIAAGASDGYLVDLGRELAESGQPTYIALLPEMNQANNAYSAFNSNGSPRARSNSTESFRQAWRRAVLVVRGGPVAVIDRRLRALHLPSLETSQSVLPIPRVAFMWAPQTAGSPDIPANRPAAYYPGSRYVDIVGTDFYSAFPNFSGLARLYSAYPSKPFGFNEWAMWRNGDPSFVRELFAFVRSHPRIGLMAYNQGLTEGGPFRLSRFPAAAREIRRQLRSSRYPAYPPDLSRPIGE